MKRFVVTLAVSTFALVLILGAVGFVAARRFIGPAVADAAGLGPWASEAGFDLQGLQNMSPEERFGHFLGGSMKFADASGTVHTVTTAPGTVQSVSNDKLTIKLNDGGSNKSFNLTSETKVRAGGIPWTGAQNTQVTPKSGDRAVVVTWDGSPDARAAM